MYLYALISSDPELGFRFLRALSADLMNPKTSTYRYVCKSGFHVFIRHFALVKSEEESPESESQQISGRIVVHKDETDLHECMEDLSGSVWTYSISNLQIMPPSTFIEHIAGYAL